MISNKPGFFKFVYYFGLTVFLYESFKRLDTPEQNVIFIVVCFFIGAITYNEFYISGR
jgi:hypothetical protein